MDLGGLSLQDSIALAPQRRACVDYPRENLMDLRRPMAAKLHAAHESDRTRGSLPSARIDVRPELYWAGSACTRPWDVLGNGRRRVVFQTLAAH